MTNTAYKNQKIALRFSKTAIDKSARDIRLGCDGDVRKAAIEKIQNFRETHTYPLMLIKNQLARISNAVNKKIIVARRLKRLPTIIDKLALLSRSFQKSKPIVNSISGEGFGGLNRSTTHRRSNQFS
jgi:CRISPR/Cas system-associated protein Csm6